MADQTLTDAIPDQAVLACRLRFTKLRRGASPTAGEIELQNSSSGVLEIEADKHPLQYLDLVVTDSAGRVVSDGHYGDIFSPLGRSAVLRLAPGEKFTHLVSLLGNVSEGKRSPGHYTVRAVYKYKYKDLRAVSEPLEFDLPARAP